MKKKTTQKKNKDILFPLKQKAYFRMFPTSGNKGMSINEFLLYAKSYLSAEKGILFKDPLWDSYTNEEVIVEYFSVLFKNDPVRREEFEKELSITGNTYDEFLKFADEKIKENKEILEETLSGLPEKITFSPDVIGDN